MKVLYVALRHDPRDPDRASGADYNFCQALLRNGMDVEVVGPFNERPIFLERALKHLNRRIGKNRYTKYALTNVWRSSQGLNKADKELNPDAIFTLFPSPLVFYQGRTPCVFRTDTTFMGMHSQGSEYLRQGPLALRIAMWQERQAFHKCTRVITQSEWSRQVLKQEYNLADEKICVFSNPAALPPHIIPDNVDIGATKRLSGPLQLLTVARDFERKGVDIALEVVAQLNASGVAAELSVCGVQGDAQPHVRYVGLFRKSVAAELEQYAQLYERAHFLIHPARFDASPIVTSEAAAFATPTISNASGGIATSVAHDESGVVLPMGSPAKAYVEAIMALIQEPQRYYDLCQRTRKRYERELNWNVAGQRVAEIVREAARS